MFVTDEEKGHDDKALSGKVRLAYGSDVLLCDSWLCKAIEVLLFSAIWVWLADPMLQYENTCRNKK